MIIFAILALVVMAEGYRLHNPPSSSVRNNVLSLMCEQNGVNNSIVEIAGANYIECMEVNFGMQRFEREFTETQDNDSYSKLFKKDCAKTTQLKDCYHKLLDTVSPCIGERNEVLIPTTKNIMDQILDFLCEDDGFIISRFITEGGPQCIQSKSNEIIRCGRNFENTLLNMDLNIILPAAHSHRKYGDLLTCVLQNLETCNNSIPSKVFKSVANIVRHSVSELARELSDNVTKEQALDRVNGTQHEPVGSDDNNNLQMLCEKNGADYKAVQAIGVQSVTCMEDGFGIKMLVRDLKEAQNNDSYAEISKRYCPRTPLLKTCIHALIYGVSPCFGDESQNYITTTITAYDGILDYICHSDGDRIARFLAEGGPECLKNKSHDIMMCAGNYKNWTITPSVPKIYGMTDKLLNCILKNLEICDNPAAFKIVESVAEIIRNSYSRHTGKNIMEKTTRSLIKSASGTVVVAFNVDIFV